MELTSNIKRLIFKCSLVILTCCVLLWFSVFSYGLLYYLYIPAIAHVKPVHLRYDTNCFKGERCAFPYDNITLAENNHVGLLSAGQAYAVELALDMPESERNLDQGMFMVHLDMLTKSGEVLKSSRRPAVLRYRSPLFKVIYTLFFVPALLAGTVEEKQSLSIPLFEKYMEYSYKPTYFAFVQIQAHNAEIYSCSLKIHAQFTGLRYMMYYWPMLSTLIGIVGNFFFVSIMVVFVWIRQIMNTTEFMDDEPDQNENEQMIVTEITESLQRNRSEISENSPTTHAGIARSFDPGNVPVASTVKIEEISPHVPSRNPKWYRGDPLPSTSRDVEQPSPESEHETAQLEEDVDDFEDISDLNPSSDVIKASPSVRKRITTS